MAGKIVVGILAPVDAGKTTLAEGILYVTGQIRKAGRVDNGDAFLDTDPMEKKRGITVFSKQARVTYGDREILLMDTPGHVDFSAETERTLQALDMAVLLISGADGVRGHAETLWRLLARYQVPTLLFVNKMDQPGTDRQVLLAELKTAFGDACQDLEQADTEELSLCTEALLEEYLETGAVSEKRLREAFAQRKLFPVLFGAALRMQGVEELLSDIIRFAPEKSYPQEFGARVIKIERDRSGKRLTHLKITGGSIAVKGLLGEEKIDQLRSYSGAGYTLQEEVAAGDLCTAVGPEKTYAGQGFGFEEEGELPSLVPVLNYQVRFPEGTDPYKGMQLLKAVEEEWPELHVEWGTDKEIYLQLMGQVQMEILTQLMQERYGIALSFGAGKILYRESILGPVRATGHYEPLKHYAEVSFCLEPGERGSGITLETVCPEDDLDRNWQRLIFTNVEEKKHPGVLTGSEITDIKITLLGGRAHLKHTEGGDFRQAVYRAIRQGLRKAESVLLEPYYAFTLTVPGENIGRAMHDMQQKCGSFSQPELAGEMSVLTGRAPVSELCDYPAEVLNYTRGRGSITLRFAGYEPCHNAQEVIERIGYQADADLENPADSVFCAHGAGFVVPWDEAEDYAHVDTTDRYLQVIGQTQAPEEKMSQPQRFREAVSREISQEEIERIFLQSYGRKPLDKNPWNRQDPVQIKTPTQKAYVYKPKKKQDSYLLVDGYNIIHAWQELKELLQTSAEAARGKLMDLLCNYAGYISSTVILVFDAYRVKDNPGEVFAYQNIYVVYTKEAETADQYIEKTVHAMDKKYDVTVATSDGLEQIIIWGQGAKRLSAQGLYQEIQEVTKGEFSSFRERRQEQGKYFPFADALENTKIPESAEDLPGSETVSTSRRPS